MSTKGGLKQYRQGDVLLRGVERLPPDAVSQKSPNSVIVLAYGEATGHAHVVDSALAVLYRAGQKEFLEINNLGAVLRHEEHSALQLEPGCYEIIRQREYEPAGWRNVVD